MSNYPTFPTLSIGPYGPIAVGSGTEAKPAVLTANFGGRYTQRTGDGVNQLPKDFNYKTVPLLTDQMKVLTDFLEGLKGYLPFAFQVPFELAPRQFICQKWSVENAYMQHQVLTALFEENFDP